MNLLSMPRLYMLFSLLICIVCYCLFCLVRSFVWIVCCGLNVFIVSFNQSKWNFLCFIVLTILNVFDRLLFSPRIFEFPMCSLWLYSVFFSTILVILLFASFNCWLCIKNCLALCGIHVFIHIFHFSASAPPKKINKNKYLKLCMSAVIYFSPSSQQFVSSCIFVSANSFARRFYSSHYHQSFHLIRFRFINDRCHRFQDKYTSAAT